MENKISYKTLIDFSTGKYSYNDYLKVKHWFINVRNDQNAEKQLFNQWQDLPDTTNTESLHLIFEKIHYQILLEEKKKEKNLWQYSWQIAAILILVIALPVLYYFLSKPGQPLTQPWAEINVPEGARIEFLLPDSTSGWLNSGAKLKYPIAFSQHRQVDLTGEAFFRVRHKEHSDFTVSVADMDIKVLGTQFNVSAYSDEAVTEVVLKEGKVEITGKTGVFRQTLQPGEKILYDHDANSLDMKKVDPKLYSAWTNGYLVIDNEPLVLAAKKLERWYGVNITIQDEALKNFRFKATFKDEPLEEVLRFFAMTTPMNYKIGNRDQGSNGILKKKQVTIKLK